MTELSAAEKQFNNQVKNSPVIKEILDDLSGLKAGQKQLGDDMKTLEQKVDGGFSEIKNVLVDLSKEIRDDKEAKLIEANKSLKDVLNKKQEFSDKIKSGSLLSLFGTVVYFVFDKFGGVIG